ncbi:hypothetical protein SteCoe_25496 [Stentor coeruleus]|uniref:Uncharacterized protein n=1 Tax=Stentor coeruleus TaxID=5963 RepID=A0A1R2BF64_9CILI|nr:hypothetical protein SteCoe_25496 [Stentor coeruleus]
MHKESYLKNTNSTSPVKNISTSTSPVKLFVSEDDILNARKHTIPQPFIFQNRIIEEKSFISQKTLKNIEPLSLTNKSQKGNMFQLTPKKQQSNKFPRLVKSAIRCKPNPGSPLKNVKFRFVDTEVMSRMNRKKEWEKIFNCIKGNSIISPLNNTQRDPRPIRKFTIKDINQL